MPLAYEVRHPDEDSEWPLRGGYSPSPGVLLDFLIQLEDGTGFIELEDGSGFIELEDGP